MDSNHTILDTLFDSFLHLNIERSESQAVRESDLYSGLKLYCRQHGQKCPAWQEFHRLLKDRNVSKRVIDGKMLIIGIRWRDGAGDRPIAAADYTLHKSEIIEATTSAMNETQASEPKDVLPWL
jgi:hypothetical protein